MPNQGFGCHTIYDHRYGANNKRSRDLTKEEVLTALASLEWQRDLAGSRLVAAQATWRRLYSEVAELQALLKQNGWDE